MLMHKKTGKIKPYDKIPRVVREAWSEPFHVGESVEFKNVRMKIIKIKKLRKEIHLRFHKEVDSEDEEKVAEKDKEMDRLTTEINALARDAGRFKAERDDAREQLGPALEKVETKDKEIETLEEKVKKLRIIINRLHEDQSLPLPYPEVGLELPKEEPKCKRCGRLPHSVEHFGPVTLEMEGCQCPDPDDKEEEDQRS